MRYILEFSGSESTEKTVKMVLLVLILAVSVSHCKLIDWDHESGSKYPVVSLKSSSMPSIIRKARAETAEHHHENKNYPISQLDNGQLLTSNHIMGEAAALTSSSGANNASNAKYCNSTKGDECWSKLPPLPAVGIPATKEELDVACRAFDSGMKCFDQWVKECLTTQAKREKARESVVGAHETFTFLCHEERFRNEYLRHSHCLRKISPYYDNCSRSLVSDIKRTMSKQLDNSFNLCCIRLRFLQCVGEVANKLCSQSAADFIQRMAETLVRSEMKHHVPKECISVTVHNCTASSGSCSALLKPSFYYVNPIGSTLPSLIKNVWRFVHNSAATIFG